MQARFWTMNKGELVRVKLNPGQTLHHESYWTHDEGWSSEFTRWHYDAANNVIDREYGSDGKDCDGRLATYGSDCCPVSELAIRHVDFDGSIYSLPEWQNQESEVYDQYARAANY